MVAEQVIKILKDSEALAALVGNRIEPHSVNGFTDGIVYSFTPLTDNNLVRTDRLEIHIISNKLATCYAIDTVVRSLLLTTGDEPLTNSIHKVEINGGGTMEDAATGTKHLITYYYIVSNGGIKE